MPDTNGRIYFVLTPQGDRGPLDRSELIALLHSGEILPHDQVRNAFGRNLGKAEDVAAARPSRRLLHVAVEAAPTRPATTTVRTATPVLVPILIAAVVLLAAVAWVALSRPSAPGGATPAPPLPMAQVERATTPGPALPVAVPVPVPTVAASVPTPTVAAHIPAPTVASPMPVPPVAAPMPAAPSQSVPPTPPAPPALTTHSPAGPAATPSTSFGIEASTASSAGPLPAGWSVFDIGKPRPAPLPELTSEGAWQLAGAGLSLWGMEDQFRLVATTLDGDGDITVRCERFVGPLSDRSKFGVILRSDTTPVSPMVALVCSATGGSQYLVRTASAGQAVFATPGLQKMPVWLRLQRRGTQISPLSSTDGITWIAAGAPAEMPGAPPRLLAGVAICAQRNDPITAVVSHVTVTATR